MAAKTITVKLKKVQLHVQKSKKLTVRGLGLRKTGTSKNS